MYVEGYSEVDDALFIDQAEASCATALALNPNLDVVHNALGRLYTSTGRYVDAEASFRRALEIDPSSVASFIGLGNVYRLTTKFADAEDNLRLSVGLHPGDWLAYIELGNFLYRSGRYEEAAEQYEYVVALDHSNMNGFSNLGTAYMLAGNFRAALSALEKSLEIEPTKITYSNLGLMHYYLGDMEKAVANHQQAIELSPGDHLAWSNLGDAFSIGDQPDAARDAFETALGLATEALNVNTSNPFTMMDLAWINAMLDNSVEARTWINKARQFASDDPYIYYYDALIRTRNEDVSGAITSLTTAVERGYSPQLLGVEPHFAALRSDPRFMELVNQD